MLACDVVIIGSGLAALAAAVAARESAASVVVISKRPFAHSGSSAMTSGGYAAVVDQSGDDSIATHIDDTLRGGAFIADPRLVATLCHEAGASVEKMMLLGALFATAADGAWRRSGAGDHSRVRSLGAVDHIGLSFVRPVGERVKALGVTVIDHASVIDVVTSGATCGVVAADTKGGQLFGVVAPSVVIATGGAGQVYPVTSNPVESTGDGYALALRAGAELRDMEFVQFYPWRCTDPFGSARVAVQPSTFLNGGHLFNAVGRRFMADYDPVRLEATTRDVAARAIYEQVTAGDGVGGGVRLDLSALDDETLERTNPKLARGIARKGIDHRSYPFVVTPEAHFMMGGVVIDEHGATSVGGLFAAGEAAGGVHGANRITNNALPEAWVFGTRAGHSAAAHAAAAHRDHAAAVAERLASRQREVDPKEARDWDADVLRRRIQQTAWHTIGIMRTGGQLAAGDHEFTAIGAELAALQPATVPDLVRREELTAQAWVGAAVAKAGLLRTESRGAHARRDFPTTDAGWHGHIVLSGRIPDLAATFVPTAAAPQTIPMNVMAS